MSFSEWIKENLGKEMAEEEEEERYVRDPNGDTYWGQFEEHMLAHPEIIRDMLAQDPGPLVRKDPPVTRHVIPDDGVAEIGKLTCSKDDISQGRGDTDQMVFSPNGEYVVLFGKGKDTTLIYVNDENCRPKIMQFFYRLASVTAIAISPDSKTILGGSDHDRTIYSFEDVGGSDSVTASHCMTPTMEMRDEESYVGSGMPVLALAFSRDGKRFISAFSCSRICIQDSKTRTAEHIIDRHCGVATAITVSPDGDTFATCHEDGDIRTWSISTGICKNLLVADPSNFLNATLAFFSADALTLTCLPSWGGVCIFSTETGALLAEIEDREVPNMSPIQAIVSPSHNVIASPVYPNSWGIIYFYDTVTWTRVGKITDPMRDEPRAIAWGPNNAFAIYNDSSELRVHALPPFDADATVLFGDIKSGARAAPESLL